MKILEYIARVRLSEGGVVRAVLDLSGALAKRGQEVTVLTGDPLDIPPEWNGAGGTPRVEVIGYPAIPLGLFSPRQLTKARALIAEHDVVHTHNLWNLEVAQIGSLARRLGVPYTCTPHGTLNQWSMAQSHRKKAFYMALFARRFLTHAASVHFTAEGERAQALQFVAIERTDVIPYVVDLSEYFEPAAGSLVQPYRTLVGDNPSVLYLSRLHYMKRIDVLVEAVALLNATTATPARQVHLLVAGTGDDDYVERIKRLVRERGLEEQVHFLGLVVGPAKVAVYQTADIFALPTNRENFGIVNVEALAAGTPVITTKGVDIWPELEKSGAATILETDAPDLARQVADAITEMLDRPGGAAEIGERGREWVADWLDPDKTIDRTEDFYRACIGART